MSVRPDYTPIMRLAREYGGFEAMGDAYEDGAFDERFSQRERDNLGTDRDVAWDISGDLLRTILWSRAETLDDVVVQALMAHETIDSINASEPGRHSEAMMPALQNALRSIAVVLVRDHGAEAIERLGQRFRDLSLEMSPLEAIDSAKGMRRVIEVMAEPTAAPTPCHGRAAS